MFRDSEAPEILMIARFEQNFPARARGTPHGSAVELDAGPPPARDAQVGRP
jgi:hypothetical protein